jgi:predicted dehydrogenase
MSQTLRAVLVGCGSISKNWVKAAAEIENFELAGFVDLSEAAARTRAEEYGQPDVLITTDLQTALQTIQPDIVFDCTIPEAHVQVTIAALESGAHVLGEKPLADSLDNARRMIAAAQAAGKTYAVMQNRRFDANIRRLRALVESGQLGPLTTLHSDFFVGAHFGGFRDRMEHVLLLDMAIHTFDAARFISGADPVSVYCKEWNPAGSWYDHDASAVCIYEMSNGLIYTYRGSWCSEGLRTSWESEWRVIGQQGSAFWHGDERLVAQVVTGDEGFFRPLQDLNTQIDVPPHLIGGHTALIKDFVDAIRTGRTPETIATDNIKSLAMVFAAIESAQTGKTVDVRW